MYLGMDSRGGETGSQQTEAKKLCHFESYVVLLLCYYVVVF